jgi:hypothetical protein
MFSRSGAGDDMFGMHSARRQDRHRVDVRAGEKIIDFVSRGNAELRRNGVGSGADRIADGYQSGPIDMTTAQQFGMTLGNAATSEQAKSDHEGFPVADLQAAPHADIDPCSLLIEAIVNQGVCDLAGWRLVTESSVSGNRGEMRHPRRMKAAVRWP